MAPNQQRRRVLAGAVVGALGLAGCGGRLPVRSTSPTTAPRSATTPTTAPGTTTAPSTVPAMTHGRPGAPLLLRTVLADATAEHWVHAVSTSPARPTEAATTFLSDDGPTRGRQEITVGSVSGDIRVVGGLTYIQGRPRALEDLFEVPAGVATQLSDTWVTLRPGDSQYQTVTAGVTIPSLLQEITFGGTVSQGTAALAGTPTTVIEGRLGSNSGDGTGALYVSRAPDPLPLLWLQVDSTGTTRTTFAKWGHPVDVTAPAGAVPLPAAAGGVTTIARLRRDAAGRPKAQTRVQSASTAWSRVAYRVKPGPKARATT